MGKNKIIAITAVAIAVVIISIVASNYIKASVQTGLLPAGAPPQWQIEVTEKGTAKTTLTVENLSQMPLTNVTNTINGETAMYIGVTLLEFLNRTGASWDTGLINAVSTGGDSKTVNLYQAWNSTQYPHNEIILAFVKNGEWMTSSNGGPVQLITPGLASAYNIENVAELQLNACTINVSGAVSNPLVLTGENITAFETKTVQAAFASGGEPQRTSDWTGADLWDILQAAGVSETASKVTVAAVDGYAKEFTVAQVKAIGILIGYKENGEYFTPVDGQPFRLVVPDEEYKWGQYWVRWISQIEVS